MRKLFCLFLLFVAASAYAGTAFLKYDYIKNNMRYCVYEHMGTEYVITKKLIEYCPLSVEVS